MCNKDFCIPFGEVEGWLKLAVNLLYREKNLLVSGENINERSLTHRLAVHLEHVIQCKGYLFDVDCEYNRMGSSEDRVPKMINECFLESEPSVCANDLSAHTIYPDIIIHHRRTDVNILVVEVKKSNHAKNQLEKDFCKLREFTNCAADGGLGYLYGASVVINDNPSCTIGNFKWFKNGACYP